MTQSHDGSSIDLERELTRYLGERRMTRRYLLDRIAILGAAAALAPVIAACTSSNTATPGASASQGGAASAAAPSNAPSAAASAAASASAGPTPEPTPVPSPEGELFIYNWADYMGKNVVPGFEKKYKIKVTYDFFDNYDTMLAKIGQGGSGYDITFPTGTDIPGLLERGLVQPIDHSLLPNIRQPRRRVAEPGLRPGQRALDPVHVVDHRRRLRHRQGAGEADQLERAVGHEVLAAHRRARRPARGVRGRAVPAWARTRTRPTTPTSTPPCSCSRSRSRWSGSTRPTTSACSRRATPGSRTPGARTCTRSPPSGRRSSSTSPRRAASAAPTRRSCSRARSTRSRPSCS